MQLLVVKFNLQLDLALEMVFVGLTILEVELVMLHLSHTMRKLGRIQN